MRVAIGIVLVTGILIAGVLGIQYVRSADPRLDVEVRVPGMEKALTDVGTAGNIEGKPILTAGSGEPSEEITANWPQFMGPGRDNTVTQQTPLARKWEGGKPPVVWEKEVGLGHAGVAVWNGRAYLHDYDASEKRDVIRCFSLTDGEDIWSFSYPVDIRDYHGMSRIVPAVTDKYLVALGPKLHLTCMDPVTGNVYWQKDLVKEFGAIVPEWYAGQGPIIENGTAVIAIGGTDILYAGFDLKTGEITWKTPNQKRWAMTHSSIMPTTIDGKKIYTCVFTGGVAAVSAELADAGKLLWQTSDWDYKTASAPSPAILDDNRIMFSAGYGTGAAMFKLSWDGEKISHEVLWRTRPPRGFGTEQQTPIYYQEHLFGILPKQIGRMSEQLVCLNPDDGSRVWASGRSARFGLGPFIIADGMIIVLGDRGELRLVEASTSGYREMAKAKVLHGHDAFAPMALVDGRLICRDVDTLICLDLRASE
ncbi:MAG: PQQ-binding-like beta-propeller repeat protein [Phycisphaerae bacterium]